MQYHILDCVIRTPHSITYRVTVPNVRQSSLFELLNDTMYLTFTGVHCSVCEYFRGYRPTFYDSPLYLILLLTPSCFQAATDVFAAGSWKVVLYAVCMWVVTFNILCMECNGLYLGDDILKCLFLNENFVFWFKFVSKTPVDCKPAWVPVPYRQEVFAWTDDGRVHWHNIYLHCNESNLCKTMIFISLSELFVFQHFVLELVSLKMFKISITELRLKIVHWHNIYISQGPVVKLVTQFFSVIVVIRGVGIVCLLPSIHLGWGLLISP